MADILLTVHGYLGYALYVVLLVAVVLAFRQAPSAAPVSRVSSLTMVALDIHVTLGIVIYIMGAWWASTFLMAVAHPVLAIAALGVGHAAIARARRPGGSARTVATGLLGAFILITGAIGAVSVQM